MNKKAWQSLVAVLVALSLWMGPLQSPSGVQARPSAGEYYVDQDNPLANDANDGSQAAPWLTIQHAADVAGPGDTIYVKSGFYPERVVPQASGASGQMITFKALPRRSVTMYGFYTVNSDYLRIEGFNITTDDSLTGWTEGYGVFIHSNHVEVVDNYFYDLKSTAIQGYWHEPFPEAAYVADNTIYHSQMGIGVSGFNWLVENNEVERLYNYGGGDSDYSRFFGEGHRIIGNYFHGTNFSEIGSAHVDCFQTFDNNGEYVHNILFDGNRCSNFHQGFMGEAAYYGNSSDVVFQNNIFEHGLAWGLCVYQIRNITVLHNTFVDIQYHAIGLQDGASGSVQNNIFYNAGSNYWADQGGSVSGSHNLLYRTSGSIDPISYPDDLVNLDPQFLDVSNGDYHLQSGSPAINAGLDAGVTADRDGMSRPQGGGFDIGAYEFAPALSLRGMPADSKISLDWTVNAALPLTTTWQISYEGPAGDQASPITGLPAETRAFVLSGLTNYTWYTVTLQAMLGEDIYLTDTLTGMPSDHLQFIPLVRKATP